MENSKHIGCTVKELSNLLDRKRRIFYSQKLDNNLTLMQSWIIGFLCRSTQGDIFQKDIEKQFEIQRSTATSILQLMEKNGYIIRNAVDHDARLKKICVTEKARALHNSIINEITEMENLL